MFTLAKQNHIKHINIMARDLLEFFYLNLFQLLKFKMILYTKLNLCEFKSL